jgi:hypothetical protein
MPVEVALLPERGAGWKTEPAASRAPLLQTFEAAAQSLQVWKLCTQAPSESDARSLGALRPRGDRAILPEL